MENLRALAPLNLINHRTRRYLGDDLCIAMSAFEPGDQHRIRELYRFLERLFALVRTRSGEDRRFAVLGLLREQSVDSLVELATQMGTASYRANPSPLLAKTIHDIRGGGLTSLIGQLDFLDSDDSTAGLDALHFLTRDHLKIMRNALLELDDAKRADDLTHKVHDTRMLAAKHDGSVVHYHERDIYIRVECPEHVAISECCVEFGALDRILYNLLNNACRHVADDTLRLVLLPVPDTDGENLRIILINSLSAADSQRLRDIDLATLFKDGVSSTGSGFGLSVAAQFVANAYGLSSPTVAVAEKYLGASILGEEIAVWFHWPILAEY